MPPVALTLLGHEPAKEAWQPVLATGHIDDECGLFRKRRFTHQIAPYVLAVDSAKVYLRSGRPWMDCASPNHGHGKIGQSGEKSIPDASEV